MPPRLSRADIRWQAVLAPQRFIRWIYVARLSVASAIFIAAVSEWFTDSEKTLIATLTFVGALFFTGFSYFWTETKRRRLTETFLYTQFIVDLLVVTAVVHLTEGPKSGFAALYILVNAGAALLFPMGGALLIALLGIVVYLADAIIVSQGFPGLDFWMQAAVFSLVAIITAYISARLREAGQGSERLAAELQSVRLREKDILANIRSGIITVDDAGTLLFANPTASELVGFDLEPSIGASVLAAVRETAPGLADALRLAIETHSPTTRTEGVVERNGRRFPLGVT
ncbi:MAG: PAS domain-containing protein, partial [Gemmatimonadetes bacterium]|nr:PAS domain-containing protein [Gemmatimonadota bacterium]